MARDLVASLVEARPRQDYEKLHLVRFTLLRETLIKNGEAGTTAARYLEENLAPISKLTANVVLSQATPFFWMNIQRCYNASWGGNDDALLANTRNLVMTAVDSFFAHLPTDHAFSLRSEKEFRLVLPRLKVSVAMPAGEVTLRRVGATTLEIDSPSRRLLINTEDVALDYQLPSLQVPDSPAVLLLSSDRVILEDDYSYSVELDTKNASSLLEQIDKALRLIRLVDGKLGSSIDRYINWYIPLINPNPESTHYSFTAKNLPGVMFLSGSYKFMPLCEAIVHEYHHHEMYVLMGTQDVLGKDADKRLFYSPWRTDARPLNGLFHALHVFTGVADFYSRAVEMDIPELKAFEHSIRYRRVLLYYQLKTGLAQVPMSELPPLGRKIYEFLEQELGRQEAALGSLLGTVPEELLGHFEAWSMLHAELALTVTLPAEFLSQPAVERAGRSPQQALST